MTNRGKILYCTIVPISQDGGGNIVCREHVRALARFQEFELHVFSPSMGDSPDSAAVPDSEGISWHYYSNSNWNSPIFRTLVRRPPFPYSFETFASRCRQIDFQFRELVCELSPDIIVVDYLFTVSVMPSSLFTAKPTVLISLNREAEFYGQMRKLGLLSADCSNTSIAEYRLARFEREAFARATRVVVLTPNDLNAVPESPEKIWVIRPVLPLEAARWADHGEQTIFFVGTVVHYPNYEAIGWLAQQLSPLLEKAAPGLRIKIIGASEEQVPEDWRRSNIDFLGRSTRKEVRRNFLEAGLFIAPIRNDFGSKIKILEAISFLTPTIATREALSGVADTGPFELIELDRPEACASKIVALLQDTPRRLEMAGAMEHAHRRQLAETSRSWSELLRELADSPVEEQPHRCFATIKPWSPFKLRRRLELLSGNVPWIVREGWSEPEALKDRPLRWAGPESSIRIRWLFNRPPRSVSLRIWPIVPDDGSPIRIWIDETEVFSGRVRNRTFSRRISLPNIPISDWLTLRVSTPGFRVPGDDRILGLAFEYLRLH